MQRACFVSDIHITSPDCPQARRFVAFLQTLSGNSNVTHLYLLGDIFDLWVADHEWFVERYREIIDEIRRLRDEGVHVAYFEGNHDLHLRYFWADQLGLTVHAGPAYVELGDKIVRLEHGDQMDPDDKGYIFLRWFLRTPPIRFLLRHLPGGFIAGIGERASSTSREYTSNTKTIEQDTAIAKIRDHAKRVYAVQPFDLIITGHVHTRDDCQVDVGDATFRSVNLGTWLDTPCYFSLDDNGEQFHDLESAVEQ